MKENIFICEAELHNNTLLIILQACSDLCFFRKVDKISFFKKKSGIFSVQIIQAGEIKLDKELNFP